MTIKKVSPREYASVNPDCVERYIRDYLVEIHKLVNNDKQKRLKDCNKAQLNQIAAELETVKKRLDYIIEGRY